MERDIAQTPKQIHANKRVVILLNPKYKANKMMVNEQEKEVAQSTNQEEEEKIVSTNQHHIYRLKHIHMLYMLPLP